MKPLVGSAVPLEPRLPFKIFQIGFNKCGTKTLHHYFSRNGIKSVHWDEGRLAQRMFANLANDKNLLAGYEQFDVFTDMEFLNKSGIYLEAYKLFPHLASQYPNALFILNTRDREAWIRSRLEHGKNLSYAHRSMLHYNVTSIRDLTDRWRIEWERHHSQVMLFFARTAFRFLVCRIETDLPHILNEVLPECKLDPALFRVKGKKESSRRGSLLPAAMHTARRFRSLIRVLPLNWRRLPEPVDDTPACWL
jgi:hypothetical protein